MQSHGSTPTARVPSATHERAAGSNLCCWPCLSSLRVCVCVCTAGPCPHIGTCSWPLLPNMSIPPDSDHHCYLNWNLGARPKGTTEYLNSPCSYCRPQLSPRTMHYRCVDNIDNEPTSHTPWTLRFYSHPYLTPHTTRATAIAHSRLPSLTSEGIYFFLKSVQKVWKRWLLLQMQRYLCMGIGNTRIGETGHHQRKW